MKHLILMNVLFLIGTWVFVSSKTYADQVCFSINQGELILCPNADKESESK